MRCVIVALICLVLPAPFVKTPALGQGSSCTGDCDGDENVSIAELVLSMNIALGVSPLFQCESIDENRDGSVTVDELVQAVLQSVTRCGRLTPVPTVTQTTTGTPSFTRTPTRTPAAPGARLGPEFQVNTFTVFSQFEPVIASRTDRGFTVMWAGDGQDECPAVRDQCCTDDQCSIGETCTCCFPNAKRCLSEGITCLPGDCPRFGVLGQNFDAEGAMLGTEFQVNTYATELQFQPDIDTNSAGSTVAVWQSREQDGSGMGIFGQRYDPEGARLGGEFQVNSTTAGDQLSPEVAVTENGDFVSTWVGSSGDGSGSGVFARRFAAGGDPIGSDFQVNTFTLANQFEVKISAVDNDETIIVWSSQEQDGSADGVFAQRYDSAGGRIGPEFAVNAYTFSAQRTADVAHSPLGGFIVTWTSAGQDGSGAGVFGRRFDPSAQAIGGEFQVNSYTVGSQLGSSVTVGPAGDFVVVWTSDAQDGDCDGVFGQRFDSVGSRVGTEFQVNTHTLSCQFVGDLTAGNGGFVVVWVGDYQDGPSSGVFGQRFAW
jgi:hypothetical protein